MPSVARSLVATALALASSATAYSAVARDLPTSLRLASLGAFQQRAALNPPNVVFNAQRIGTSSLGRPFVFSAFADMVVDSVSVTAGADEFRKVSDGCTGVHLEANQDCTFSIRFVPTATGSHTGVVTVFERGTPNTYTAELRGSIVDDYTISVNPPAITVKRGQTASVAVTLAPVGTFDLLTTLSCDGLPSPGSCTFAPLSVTPGAAPVTVGLTIRTFAPTSSASAAVLVPALLLIVVSGWRSRRRVRVSIFAALIACAAFAGNGCESNAPPEPEPEPTAGTPIGTFTIDVVGKTGTSLRTASLVLTIE